jgi:beta-glucosidase
LTLRVLIGGVCATAALCGAGFAGGPGPVAPARAAAGGITPWLNIRQSAERRAAELLAAMSLTQKLTLVASNGGGIPSLGVPPLKFIDGANGIGDGSTHVTAFPDAVNVAASWDRSLAQSYGTALGAEAFGQGDTLLAAPTINIVRTPKWGRDAETLGEDPFLSGALASPEIQGIQANHVIAQVKHFAGYNQEIGRLGEPLEAPAVSDRVSERALQEIYFPAFKAAVQLGGAASVMCSYNRINGLPSCQDPATLGQLAGWGLRGFVEPDAGLAIRDTVAAARAGVDNFQLGSLPNSFGAPDQTTLSAAVRSGRIPISRLNDMARRILLAMFAVGMFDHRPTGRGSTDVSAAAHHRLGTRIAEEGTVLLKNSHHLLPLPIHAGSLAVIGADAGTNTTIEENGSPAVIPDGPVITPLAGIRALAPPGTNISYTPGTLGVVQLPLVPSRVWKRGAGTPAGLNGSYYSGPDLRGLRTLGRIDPTINFLNDFTPPGAPSARFASVRWRGTLIPPSTGLYRFSLTMSGTARFYLGGRLIVHGDDEFFGGSENPGVGTITFQGVAELKAGHPVPIRLDYSNGASVAGPAIRLGWQPPTSTLLSAAVAAARRARVAIVFANDVSSEGMDRPSLSLPGDQDQLIEAVADANPDTVVVLHTSGPVLMPWLSRVAGVLESWYPGQQSGAAIAATLFGHAEPGGRLPVTFPASEQQGPANVPSEYPGVNGVADYREGIYVGYRYYDEFGEKPLFPFGYGLSYTTFSLRNMTIRRVADRTYTVSAKVENTGVRSGEAVIELYVGYPRAASEPPDQLKGFVKLTLAPRQTSTVRFTLTPTSLAAWNAIHGAWRLVPGRYGVLVGTSSRDLPLRSAVQIP